MRILYVSSNNPAIDTILNGMDEKTLAGLPAFYYPFKILLDRGNTIDLLLFTSVPRKVVESDHFKKENLIQILPELGWMPGVLSYPIQLSKTVKKLLMEHHYDFVYGMSEGSHMAVREAAKMGIPCALRQFGTQEMVNVLEPVKSLCLRRIKALKDYTYITLSLSSKKSFLLATNDGSRTDKIYEILKIKKKKYRFFFWTSGVYIPDTQPKVDFEPRDQYPKAYDPLALSVIGRIAPVKRQDRAVHILGELHRRGYHFHLYFIGLNDCDEMYQTVMDVAEEYGVIEYIHFEGAKSQNECRQYALNSFATILPCEWNRVNIFYEVMGEGAVVVTNDNHSIDDFIEDGVNCLVYEEDNFAQAAEKIISLVNNQTRIGTIRAAAHLTAKERFMDLEERFGMEAQLVEDVAMGRDISNYPDLL